MPAAPEASRPAVTSLALIALVVSVGLIGCNSVPPAPLPTVASVELPRYMGSWFEIAKLPNRFQASCASDTVATYRLQDDGVEVINRCRHADGSVDSIEGRAKAVPGSAGSRLRVSFFWPIYGDYWVLALDPDYQTALIGAPSRQYAWILSRSATLDEGRLQALLERAQALGFDRAAFTRTPQTAAIGVDAK